MSELHDIAALAEDIARRAGRLLAEMRVRHTVSVSTKEGGSELVTSADEASNELIWNATQKATPDAQFFSEEGPRAIIDWSRPVWVVDPLDGTVNYVRGHTHVGVSIAYVVEGTVRVGVVRAPFQGETFVAVRDEGARLDAKPLLPVSDVGLADALVSTGFPHDRRNLDDILHRLGRVTRACRDLRRLASPSLDICWVAAGRLDAAYETLRPWDVAAAGLIARETHVARAHYSQNVDTAIPEELRGDDVVFARERLLAALLPVLSLHGNAPSELQASSSGAKPG